MVVRIGPVQYLSNICAWILLDAPRHLLLREVPSSGPSEQPNRGTFMRMLTTLIALLSAIALTACAGSDDGSEQPHRSQAGPYIGGSAGVGF
jgi:hypothetical protein